MKKSTKIRAVLFVAVICLSVIGGWLSGFNFDKRSPDVAFWFGITLLSAAWLSFFPHIEDDE